MSATSSRLSCTCLTLHTALVRARVPNGNPVADLTPKNMVADPLKAIDPSSKGVGWKQTTAPPKSPPMQLNVDGGIRGRDHMAPLRNTTTQPGAGMRNFYSRLLGGYAERFSPPVLEGPMRAYCNCDVCVLDKCNVPCSTCTPTSVTYAQTSLNSSKWHHHEQTVGGIKPLLWCMNGDYFSSLQ